MNSLIAMLLVPIGFTASLARPFLGFFGWILLLCGGFASLNPGLVDPAQSMEFIGMGIGCMGGRYGCDLLQSFIHNRI